MSEIYDTLHYWMKRIPLNQLTDADLQLFRQDADTYAHAPTLMPRQRPGRSRQDYATPRDFVRAAQLKLGIDHFEFDFAADATNTVAPHFWTAADDSLVKTPEQWRAEIGDGWGWLNPPFKRIGPWARRCADVAALGGAIAFLVPASIGANWFRDDVDGKAHVLALNGRLPFIPEQPTWLYPKDCILCLFHEGSFGGVSVWDWRAELRDAQGALSFS